MDNVDLPFTLMEEGPSEVQTEHSGESQAQARPVFHSVENQIHSMDFFSSKLLCYETFFLKENINLLTFGVEPHGKSLVRQDPKNMKEFVHRVVTWIGNSWILRKNSLHKELIVLTSPCSKIFPVLGG